ncbi:MAG: hypothetical protein FJ271_26915 [Planctomycetes bacterium]|nr:hypothetical protein [Planctomycetota bacterium]
MKTTGTMTLLLVGVWTSVLSSSGVQPAAQEKYDSPYALAFSHPRAELLSGFQGRRGDPRQSSIVPFADWYSAHTRKQYGHWGPPARHYQAPQSIAGRSLEWRRERVIAVAARYIGYGYQHHHLPDWDPPAGWPWAKTATGHNGKGVDCSNFTAFVYNVGFGIKPSSAIGKQAQGLDIPGPGKAIRAKRIDLTGDYDDLVKTLQTGDLLFIRNRSEKISHVVLWVGGIGRAPDNVPLILDSHGDGVKDSSGHFIPAGVHLRPFREKSWYFRSASHAIRILHR